MQRPREGTSDRVGSSPPSWMPKQETPPSEDSMTLCPSGQGVSGSSQSHPKAALVEMESLSEDSAYGGQGDVFGEGT